MMKSCKVERSKTFVFKFNLVFTLHLKEEE
jgi:hypothetical protein